jgi:hypothetical protein
VEGVVAWAYSVQALHNSLVKLVAKVEVSAVGIAVNYLV